MLGKNYFLKISTADIKLFQNFKKKAHRISMIKIDFGEE